MTVQNMKPLVDYLQKRRVAFYAGYPSAFYLLASYLLRENIRLDRPPRVVITNSESLLPHQRRTIAQALECEVADYYGQEVGVARRSFFRIIRARRDADFPRQS